MAKSKQISVEEQMKILQKQFGAVVMTVKQLKCTVDSLEKKLEEKQPSEIEEIFAKQRAIDQKMKENIEAIKRLDEELEIINKDSESVANDKKEVTERNLNEGDKRVKICRYFNRGFCKFRSKCRYFHSQRICEKIFESQSCDDKNCEDRHPNQCKWYNSSIGCRRNSECLYLHGIPVGGETGQTSFTGSYKCEGCKDIWSDKNHVQEHVINHKRIYFCLNCDDWIGNKSNVLTDGWTLFDEAGNLKHNI